MAGQLPPLSVAAAALSTPGRIGGAALLGVALAVVVGAIWRAAAAYTPPPSNPLGSIGRAVIAAGAGAVVMTAGSLAGLAWLQVRPLWLAWPVAVGAAYLVVRGLVAATPVVTLAHWWAVTALPVVLALVALAASRGWTGLAGVVLLAAVLVAAKVLPGPVHDRLQRHDDRAKLAALPFPLMLPAVPGYKVASAYPLGDCLAVSMVSEDARPNQWGAYDDLAFRVTIGPAGDAYLAALRARCLAEGQRAGPAQWVVPGVAGLLVLADHGDVLAEASAYHPDSAPMPVVVQAAGDLRPVGIDAIMSERERRAQ